MFLLIGLLILFVLFVLFVLSCRPRSNSISGAEVVDLCLSSFYSFFVISPSSGRSADSASDFGNLFFFCWPDSNRKYLMGRTVSVERRRSSGYRELRPATDEGMF